LTCWLYIFIRHEDYKVFWFLCLISIAFCVHQTWSFKLLVCPLFEDKELVHKSRGFSSWLNYTWLESCEFFLMPIFLLCLWNDILGFGAQVCAWCG
jgi:hypothetical protein